MAQRKNTEQDEQREERQDEQRSDEAQQDVKVPSEQDLGLDRGYIGQKVDPRPNEEYSQETDPTQSPSALDSARITHERAGEALSNPDGSTTEGGE